MCAQHDGFLLTACTPLHSREIVGPAARQEGTLRTVVDNPQHIDKVDTGNIIMRESTDIGPNETAGELHDRLKKVGSELILKTVKAIQEGEFSITDQDILLKDMLSSVLLML